jgi:hypothetical protein
MYARSLSGLVAAAALALLPGCSITSDHFSCAVNSNGMRVRCVDYENVGVAFRPTVETLCRGLSGDFSTSETCPQQGKIGGCREETSNYTQISWYYPDSIAKTPDEVKGRCSGKSYFVDASGMRPPDASGGGADLMSGDAL